MRASLDDDTRANPVDCATAKKCDRTSFLFPFFLLAPSIIFAHFFFFLLPPCLDVTQIRGHYCKKALLPPPHYSYVRYAPIFYKNISRTSAVSSTNFGSILIFARCVVIFIAKSLDYIFIAKNLRPFLPWSTININIIASNQSGDESGFYSCTL